MTTPSVSERYSPAMPFCAASAISTTTRRSDTDSDPASLRKMRKPARIRRYIVDPRITSSSRLLLGTNISRQSIACMAIMPSSHGCLTGCWMLHEPALLRIPPPHRTSTIEMHAAEPAIDFRSVDTTTAADDGTAADRRLHRRPWQRTIRFRFDVYDDEWWIEHAQPPDEIPQRGIRDVERRFRIVHPRKDSPNLLRFIRDELQELLLAPRQTSSDPGKFFEM